LSSRLPVSCQWASRPVSPVISIWLAFTLPFDFAKDVAPIIPLSPLAPAPLRTVLALFTHTAPHMVNSRSRRTAFSAIRRNVVSTTSPHLSTEGVSSRRATMCGPLPSSSITRLHRYYWAIRLPTPYLLFSLFGCPAYSPCGKKAQGLPGCRIITMSDMPWSPTPRKQTSPCQ